MEAIFHGLHVFEVPGDQFDEAVMVKIASRGYDDVPRCEAVTVSFDHRCPFEALYSFFRAQDRLAQRMILPKVLSKDFVDQIIGIILVHFDLFHDHARSRAMSAVSKVGFSTRSLRM